MMLVPRLAPRYLLIPDAPRKQLRAFDLLRPSGPGVAVLHGDDVFSFNAALSADGGSICLACVGSMRVYDTAPLLEAAKTLLERSEAEAEDQVGPRACAPNIEGHSTPADVVFSQDSDRLFVLWRNESGITVHDPCQPNLPMLRRLSFHGPSHYLSNSMLACANGLLAAAAGGGDGSPLPSSEQEARLRRQVKLWRVDADGETELRTLSTPDLADSIAISPGGDLIAIGLRNGGVRWIPFRQFLSPMATDDGAEGEQYVHVEPEAAGESTSVPMAHTLCFSHDGSKLVVGRADLDDFTIYEVASAAVVGRFVHKKSAGASATFFPADDVLVTGTVASGQPCVFHRLLPPIPRFELALSDTSVAISSSDVAPGGELGPIIAMAAGSQLYVYTTTRKVLLHHDFGKELFTSLNRIRTAVRMDPNGKFVACVLMKATVVVMSVADGSELLRMDPNGCHGMWWSPDGALLAVACLTGTRVFSTDMGFAEIQHLSDDGFSVSACVFDKTGTRLATAGNAGRVTIWEVATWRPTRKLEVGSLIYDVCFSSNGDRLAYQALEDLHVGVFSLEAESDAEQQVVFSKVNAVSDLKFSPDGNFLLCCPSAERSFDLHRMRVLDLTTQTDAEWGELLRAMALPVAGTLCGRTLGWAELTQSEGDITGDSSNLHWTLYGAVGNRMVATDIDASVQAIQDNAWTPEQLAFCSQHLQEDLGSIVEDAPHCSNIRDKDTGETVLHQLARARQTKSLQKWLSACPHATPVADNQGLTAVQVAVQLEQIDSAQAMWEARVALPSFITSISASLVLQELQLLPKTHPHLVRSFLLDVEPAIVRTLSTFRTELAREVEVCGLPTATHHGGSTDDNGVFQSVASERPLIWSDKCSADSLKQVVAWRVVVLPNLLGDAKSSPFHDITARCGAPVFDSKLLELVVQSKWEENVSTRRMWSIVAYGCAGVIEAVAMVVSAKSENAGTNTFSAAGMLQGLVMVIELSSLGFDAFQMASSAQVPLTRPHIISCTCTQHHTTSHITRDWCVLLRTGFAICSRDRHSLQAREGLKAYLTGPWNVLGVVTSTLLLIGSAFHFMRVGDGVRTVGALGVALKCFGLVNYLRSFPATGSLIRMISVRVSVYHCV